LDSAGCLRRWANSDAHADTETQCDANAYTDSECNTYPHTNAKRDSHAERHS